MISGSTSAFLRTSTLALLFLLATSTSTVSPGLAATPRQEQPQRNDNGNRDTKHSPRLLAFVQAPAPNGGSFAGNLTLTSFSVANGVLMASGKLSGTLVDSSGRVIGAVDPPVSAPVTSASGTCDILNLTLGAFDANVLGLMVHFDPVGLSITGEQGSGSPVGSLLCSIVSLLSVPATALSTVASLLNQLLGVLGGL